MVGNTKENGKIAPKDLRALAERCTVAARACEQGPIPSIVQHLLDACAQVGSSWCGSWFGYHSRVYIEGFRAHRPHDDFNTSWGISSSRGGPWIEYGYEAVKEAILERAGHPDLSALEGAAHSAESTFEDVRRRFAPVLDALVDSHQTESLKEKKEELSRLRSETSEKHWLAAKRPKMIPLAGDERALSEGPVAPHHLVFQASIVRLTTLQEALARLREILLYTADYVEQRVPPVTPASFPGMADGATVFLIHGHDDSRKNEVAGFVQAIHGTRPTILHEQPDGGRTIIEKLEHHASQACFAVAILTADDKGGINKRPPVGASRKQVGHLKKRGKLEVDLKPRARQNVVLELGYFWAKLARQNVVILHEPGVELPSDVQGVLYKPLDDAGAWKRELAKEMESAGLKIDWSKLL